VLAGGSHGSATAIALALIDSRAVPTPIPTRLGYGQFFGECEVSREVAGFSLSLRTPDPRVVVERHTHEEAHFILLLDGHYISSARDAGHILGGPALIYNPPGTTHRDRFEGLRGRFLAISVARERHASVASEVPLLPAAVRLARREAVTLGQRLVAEQLAWSPGSRLVAEGLCVEMLAEVARRAAALPSSPPPWLRRVREALHDRCDEDLAIAELAAEAGVHAIYLARCFRRFFGCAPGDYLRLCRLERARSLLVETTCTLAEIALHAGFVDQSHLGKAFKRSFGVTPGEYRRRFAR
jgi:AraC family transcriptional regulator